MGQPGTLYLCYPSSKPHPQPHSSAHLFGINQVDQQAEGFRSLERLGQGLRAENELRSGLRQPRATQGNLKNRVFPPGRAGDQGGTDRYPPTRWVSGDKTPWVSRGGVGSHPHPTPLHWLIHTAEERERERSSTKTFSLNCQPQQWGGRQLSNRDKGGRSDLIWKSQGPGPQWAGPEAKPEVSYYHEIRPHLIRLNERSCAPKDEEMSQEDCRDR